MRVQSRNGRPITGTRYGEQIAERILLPESAVDYLQLDLSLGADEVRVRGHVLQSNIRPASTAAVRAA